MIVPEGFQITPTHHGDAMTYKGSRVRWEGDYEVQVIRFACDCGFTCEVHTREMDGGPEVVQARQSRRCGACRDLSDEHVPGCDGTWGR